jgi:hypothetical protein
VGELSHLVSVVLELPLVRGKQVDWGAVKALGKVVGLIIDRPLHVSSLDLLPIDMWYNSNRHGTIDGAENLLLGSVVWPIYKVRTLEEIKVLKPRDV